MKMAKLEAAMRIVLEFNQAFNRQDVAGMMQLMSDDCIIEHAAPAPDGAVLRGKEAVHLWRQPHMPFGIADYRGLVPPQRRVLEG